MGLTSSHLTLSPTQLKVSKTTCSCVCPVCVFARSQRRKFGWKRPDFFFNKTEWFCNPLLQLFVLWAKLWSGFLEIAACGHFVQRRYEIIVIKFPRVICDKTCLMHIYLFLTFVSIDGNPWIVLGRNDHQHTVYYRATLHSIPTGIWGCAGCGWLCVWMCFCSSIRADDDRHGRADQWPLINDLQLPNQQLLSRA